jgi:MoxR-like ATPase
LLEAAEEGSVSVDGLTHHLPSPFVLLATQNPYGQAGTYPLAEGTLDRFALALTIGRAGADAERDVLLGGGGRGRLAAVTAVTSPAEMSRAKRRRVSTWPRPRRIRRACSARLGLARVVPEASTLAAWPSCISRRPP